MGSQSRGATVALAFEADHGTKQDRENQTDDEARELLRIGKIGKLVPQRRQYR